MLMTEFKIEDAIAVWKKEGREEGIEEGMAKGIAKGIAKGMAKGIAEGIEEGIAKGIAEGMTRGQMQIALNLFAGKGKDTSKTEIAETLRELGISDEIIQSATMQYESELVKK